MLTYYVFILFVKSINYVDLLLKYFITELNKYWIKDNSPFFYTLLCN